MEPPFKLLGEANVPLLVIGAIALQAHHYARQTIDCDCLIASPDLAPLATHLARGGYREEGRVGSFVCYAHIDRQRPPLDIMLVDEMTFAKLFSESIPYEFGEVTLRVPTLLHLIALKLHAMKNAPSRAHRDLADIIEVLESNRRTVTGDNLAVICARYGPPGIFDELKTRIAS